MKLKIRSSIGLSLVFLFAVTGCSTFGGSKASLRKTIRKYLGLANDPYSRPIPSAPLKYQQSYQKVEDRKFQEAIPELEAFIKSEPHSSWVLAAEFNLGFCYENIGERQKALEFFQNVIHKGGNSSQLVGLALLRVSIVQEGLGDEIQALAALKDAERRSKFLPKEVAEAEVPARLASAYSGAHNFEEAEKYFAVADKALARLRADSVHLKEQPDWIARLLYSMGSRPQMNINWEQFEGAVLPLEKGQGYLLQSIEMGQMPWADLAQKELLQSYHNLRHSIETIPLQKEAELVVAVREHQSQRWARLVRLNDAIEKLKQLYVSDLVAQSQPGEPLSNLIQGIDSLQEEIQGTLIKERPALEDVRRKLAPPSLKKKTIDAKPMFPGEE